MYGAQDAEEHNQSVWSYDLRNKWYHNRRVECSVGVPSGLR